MSDWYHPKLVLMVWDPTVVDGMMEELDEWFIWNDCHWRVPKRLLLSKANEWSETLDMYCNHEGITGTNINEIVQSYGANPLAPCAFYECSNVEDKVKGFARCMKCCSVSYCSVHCQRKYFGKHKEMCVP